MHHEGRRGHDFLQTLSDTQEAVGRTVVIYSTKNSYVSGIRLVLSARGEMISYLEGQKKRITESKEYTRMGDRRSNSPIE